MLSTLEKAKALREFNALRLALLGSKLKTLEKVKSLKRFNELRLLLGGEKPQQIAKSEPLAQPEPVASTTLTLADIKNWSTSDILNFWDKKGERYYPSNKYTPSFADDGVKLGWADNSGASYGSQKGIDVGSWYVDGSTRKFVFAQLRASDDFVYANFGLKNPTKEQLYAIAAKELYSYLKKLEARIHGKENSLVAPVRELSSNMLQLVASGLFHVDEDGEKLVTDNLYLTTGKYTVYKPHFDIKTRTSAFYKAYYTDSDKLVEDNADNQEAVAEFLAYAKSLVSFVPPTPKPEPIAAPNPDKDYLQSIIDGKISVESTSDIKAVQFELKRIDAELESNPNPEIDELLDQSFSLVKSAAKKAMLAAA